MRNIKKRICGVLLLEKPGALNEESKFNILIDEYAVTGPNSLDKPQKLRPKLHKKVKKCHTGLEELWKDNENRMKTMQPMHEGNSNLGY